MSIAHLTLDILLVLLAMRTATELNDSYNYARRKIDKRSMLSMAASSLMYCFVGVYWIFNYHVTKTLTVSEFDAYLLTAFNYTVIGSYALSSGRFKGR